MRDTFLNKGCVDGIDGKTQHTIVELKRMCEILGISQKGNKAELCSRLKDYFDIRFHEKDICPICLEVSDFTLKCKHDYHEKCLKDWFKVSKDYKCSLCQKSLTYKDLKDLNLNKFEFKPERNNNDGFNLIYIGNIVSFFNIDIDKPISVNHNEFHETNLIDPDYYYGSSIKFSYKIMSEIISKNKIEKIILIVEPVNHQDPDDSDKQYSIKFNQSSYMDLYSLYINMYNLLVEASFLL